MRTWRENLKVSVHIISDMKRKNPVSSVALCENKKFYNKALQQIRTAGAVRIAELYVRWKIMKLIRKKIRFFLDAICYPLLHIKLHLLHHYSCCICGNKELQIYSSYWRRSIVKCLRCDFKFALTRQSLIDVKRIHGRSYWKGLNTELGCDHNFLAWEDWQKWKRTLLQRFNFRQIEKELGSSRAVLDIGCGNGMLLEIFLQQGWKCTGVDFSEFLKDISFSPEINIIIAPFEKVSFNSKQFDLITLMHILEHFFDPVRCLIKIKRILKDDGYLLIEIPLTQDYYGIYHQSYFTRKSLYRLLKKVGMHIIQCFTYKDEIKKRRHSNFVVLAKNIKNSEQKHLTNRFR
ncbi:MAG: class I SAM-dependent methyltransferase [Candidatus Omnitrophota bacterium]